MSTPIAFESSTRWINEDQGGYPRSCQMGNHASVVALAVLTPRNTPLKPLTPTTYTLSDPPHIDHVRRAGCAYGGRLSLKKGWLLGLPYMLSSAAVEVGPADAHSAGQRTQTPVAYGLLSLAARNLHGTCTARAHAGDGHPTTNADGPPVSTGGPWPPSALSQATGPVCPEGGPDAQRNPKTQPKGKTP
jgi:hypothetical protein